MHSSHATYPLPGITPVLVDGGGGHTETEAEQPLYQLAGIATLAPEPRLPKKYLH